jgi:hypothetical protein
MTDSTAAIKPKGMIEPPALTPVGVKSGVEVSEVGGAAGTTTAGADVKGLAVSTGPTSRVIGAGAATAAGAWGAMGTGRTAAWGAAAGT